MRLRTLFIFNTLFVTLFTLHAFNIKKQFYPSMVYLARSKVLRAVLWLQLLILVVIMADVLVLLLFGELRPTEVEHLVENFWSVPFESLVMFSMFSVGADTKKFIMKIAFLFVAKGFHVLAEGRVDLMARMLQPSQRYHARIIATLVFLAILDISQFEYSYHWFNWKKSSGMQLVFAFEYAILTTRLANICADYAILITEARRGRALEDKMVYQNYIQLITEAVRLCLYLSFAYFVIRINSLPIFLIRPLAKTIRKFLEALQCTIDSQRALNKLNGLPSGTAEDLREHSLCVVCRDEMRLEQPLKKLHCRHVFHFACLKLWFQRQQACPTCRTSIFQDEHHDFDDEDDIDEPEEHHEEVGGNDHHGIGDNADEVANDQQN